MLKDTDRPQRLEALRRRLAAAQIELALCVEELLTLVTREPGDPPASSAPDLGRHATAAHRPRTTATPVVDPTTHTILWDGRVCHLGCGITFELFERLAKRPNQYASYERLFQDVWHGDTRSDETLRSEVRRIRRGLRAAGMGELARKLKGSNRHYGLILQDGT